MRSFSEVEIEKWIKFIYENGFQKEQFLGRCYVCGKLLNKLELPQGHEKKIVCLKDQSSLAQQIEILLDWQELQ